MPLLSMDGICGGYGNSEVLFDLSLTVSTGEVVALVGRNGMGKTTTIRMLTGERVPTAGDVMFDGIKLNNLPEHRIARAGIGLVPEGRHCFPNLTILEHLVIAERNGGADAHWTRGKVLTFFPRLEERLWQHASTLSGGEQQMLAIARALMTNPKLLVLDEATEGLAPIVRQEIWARLKDIASTGLSVLVIDKDITALSEVANRFYMISKGQIVWNGTSRDFMADPDMHHKYLGV